MLPKCWEIASKLIQNSNFLGGGPLNSPPNMVSHPDAHLSAFLQQFDCLPSSSPGSLPGIWQYEKSLQSTPSVILQGSYTESWFICVSKERLSRRVWGGWSWLKGMNPVTSWLKSRPSNSRHACLHLPETSRSQRWRAISFIIWCCIYPQESSREIILTLWWIQKETVWEEGVDAGSNLMTVYQQRWIWLRRRGESIVFQQISLILILPKFLVIKILSRNLHHAHQKKKQ